MVALQVTDTQVCSVTLKVLVEKKGPPPFFILSYSLYCFNTNWQKWMALLNVYHYCVLMQFLPSSTGNQSFNNQNNVAAGEGRARALYAFTSDCDEELSLQVHKHLFSLVPQYTVEMCYTEFLLPSQVGDIVTGLESVDEEWFLGDLRGKRALVPKNYVQVLE